MWRFYIHLYKKKNTSCWIEIFNTQKPLVVRVPIKCETKQKRNEINENETKRNQQKRNEINEMKTK